MSLPVTNLDDRSFQDIVDEAKRLIPTYCPEWTNHNLSDPGVALIELFAWMTEMTLFRLNQVPDVFYTRMLNLIGFEPFPATAARTDLTFWLISEIEQHVAVPVGTQVATSGELGAQRVFSTLDELIIASPTLIAGLTSSGSDTYVDVWDDLRIDRGSVACFPTVTPGDAFYLGFEQTLAGNAIKLEIAANVEGHGIIPSNPPMRWEVWQGEGWIPAKVYSDTTGGLNRNGNIVLLIPNKHEAVMLGGQRAYWLRAKLLPTERDQPGYRASPQVSHVRVASVGGTVRGEHSETMPREVLGQSTGKPDQSFVTRAAPVLIRRSTGSETVEVTETADDGNVRTVEWTEVPDFCRSGPDDRHFVWNSTTGEVLFGPLIRYPDGSTRQHGAIPREGAIIAVTGYRSGGGAAGNVGSGTLKSLRTTIPYIDRVENLEAAAGGVDAETPANAKNRGPQSLRTGARAVTAEDFERIAAEADASIARVRCLPPAEPGKPIRLLVVPKVERDPEDLQLDDFALPEDMVERISSYLDVRRILGTSIEIGTPYYQGVTVAALIAAKPGRPASLVRERAMGALYRYVNPVSGGADGNGWGFDADLNAAAVYQLLEAVEGVERFDEVLFFEYDLRNHKRKDFGKDLVKLKPFSLFLSANHQVVVR
jgi:predicted phage baseplate assembly protein